jgi:hypothetical protein
MEGFLVPFLLGVFVVLAILKPLTRVRWRRGTYRPNRRYEGGPAWKIGDRQATADASSTVIELQKQQNMSDPKDQMTAVARVGFEPVPLLNKSEAQLLPVLELAVRNLNSGYRVMAQTSLGEVIRPVAGSTTKQEQDAAYASINSKRLDFAIIDRFGILRLAIEYQGHGHYRETSFMRDAVKREALRKAGVPMLEMEPDFGREDVVRAVTQRLSSDGLSRAGPKATPPGSADRNA